MANNNSRIVMLLSIIRRGKGGAYIKMLQENDVALHYQCVGEGTAPSELLDILGLGNSEKDIMISFATDKTADRIASSLSKNVGSSLGYQGLFMIIPTSAFSRISAEIIKRNSNDSTKGGADKMQSEYKYSLILISVNRGYTDNVMQTAKAAGATGGGDSGRGHGFRGHAQIRAAQRRSAGGGHHRRGKRPSSHEEF